MAPTSFSGTSKSNLAGRYTQPNQSPSEASGTLNARTVRPLDPETKNDPIYRRLADSWPKRSELENGLPIFTPGVISGLDHLNHLDPLITPYDSTYDNWEAYNSTSDVWAAYELEAYNSIPDMPLSPVSSSKQLNGDEIAEALQAEAAFTIATDKKPIVASYGAGPCVIAGGYDATNKTAFIVHFSNAEEVKKFGCGLISYNISKLANKKIEKPIQLHLRGGIEGESEATVKAIKFWMKQRSDLPMEIASEDILAKGMSFEAKSLSIDSRNGEVAEYDPMANPRHRDMTPSDILFAIGSGFVPCIKLAYSPNQHKN